MTRNKVGGGEKLPIQIRRKTQDWDTRYLDDPRIMYVEEFNDEHANDDFVAVIPTDRSQKARLAPWWVIVAGIPTCFAIWRLMQVI